MEFLSEYGLFLAKAVTLVAAVVVILAAIASAAQKARGQDQDDGELHLKKLNDRYRDLRENMEKRILDHHERKAWEKTRKKEEKEKKKQQKKKSAENSQGEGGRPRVFVIDFHGDIKASDTPSFRQSISAVLGVANPEKDEVVVRLESGGGLVHSYGLAAAQMDRIRTKGVRLTACVDKVAASGGYMMACVADRIVASPFAIVGSIGVVAQLPNFHRFLKKNDVDFEVLTAGEHKRTLTIFGENTDKGREKFVEDLEDTHKLFKEYVGERRPAVDMNKVANGDVWFGRRALDVQLIDEVQTSDEYLISACDRADVVEVSFHRRKSLPEKLGMSAGAAVEHSLWRVLGSLRHRYFS